MDPFVKFTSQSRGRDRIFRAAQYACSLAVYLPRNNSDRKDFVAKLKSLETSLSAGRKLVRLGNAAAKPTVQLSDRVLRLTVANVSRALYFICDNVLWAKSVGLIRNIDKEQSLNSSHFYFFSLVMRLSRDVYAVLQVMTNRSRDKNVKQRLDQHLTENS